VAACGALVGLLLAAALLVTPSRSYAQTESEFAIWTAAFATAQLFPKPPSPTFWLDVHARRSEPGTLLILRPGLGYAFTSWGSIWVGYDWVPSFVDATGERVDTHGIWEQLTFDYAPRRLTFQSRTRFEQDWSDAGSGMRPRLRQFVRTNVKPSESVPLGIALWDEVFFSLKSTEWARGGFLENRLFAGLAIFANRFFRVEPGYMFVNVKKSDTVLLSHIFAINFFVNYKPK
jgi:hypothetical protein